MYRAGDPILLFVEMDDCSVHAHDEHHSQQTQQSQPLGRHAQFHPAVRVVREGRDELNSEKYPSENASQQMADHV